MDKLTEAYLSVYESSHLETDMKKRKEDNEKAVEDIKKTKAHQEMAKTAAKKFDEEFDSYDVVLEYLMNEGYADTEENAITIMANMSEEWRTYVLDEATAMATRGHDEAPIRQKIAKSTGGGQAADRATTLANRPTYGDGKTAQQRQRLARSQRADFRNTTSSNPGLHGYAHQSNDPKVKAKQAARGAQRGVLTPNEKKQLGR